MNTENVLEVFMKEEIRNNGADLYLPEFKKVARFPRPMPGHRSHGVTFFTTNRNVILNFVLSDKKSPDFSGHFVLHWTVLDC